MSSKEGTKIYSVTKTKGLLDITGNEYDSRWRDAAVLHDFHYPWESDQPPPTAFRALHNDQWFYCRFDVSDPAVYIHHETRDKHDVVSSSRAEIFFKGDDRLAPYYCLEIDPIGRVLDYQGIYHRNFDFNWSWPAGHLLVHAENRKEGYTIQAAISKTSLRDLGLLKNSNLQAGIFRGDCRPTGDGNFQFRWISWVRPDSETPDFHIASSFGLLHLEE